MDRKTFDAIMNTVSVENTDSDSVVNATIQKYGSLSIGMSDVNNYFYMADIQELIDGGITVEDLELARRNGWAIKDENTIFKTF
jgi:hypothetical protein